MKLAPLALAVFSILATAKVSLCEGNDKAAAATDRASTPYSSETQLVPPRRKEMIDLGSHKLQILRGGQGGPTVVLEAGLGGTLNTWADILPALNGFTSTICYSRAGYGGSETTSDTRTPLEVADELHALLGKVGVKAPYVLVGHSLGAIYIRVFALRYPREVAGLVLVDGSHEKQFRMVFGNHPTEITRQIDASVPAGAPQVIRTEWAAMRPFYLSGSLDVEGELPDVPMAVLTSLQVPPAAGMSAGLSDAERASVPNVKRRLNNEVFQSSTNGIEIVTKKSGHFIQNDEPSLVVDAIKWIVEAHRRGTSQPPRPPRD
jgi:pimeloyl-ACP methyl ester carboxylesterase